VFDLFTTNGESRASIGRFKAQLLAFALEGLCLDRRFAANNPV